MDSPEAHGQPQLVPVILVLVSAVLGALGQYAYKTAAKSFSVFALHRNWPFLFGLASFIVVGVLFLAAFRMGGRLSVVYPVYATTFIWATLFAVWLDREPYAPIQLAGLVLLVVGVSLIAGFSPRGP